MENKTIEKKTIKKQKYDITFKASLIFGIADIPKDPAERADFQKKISDNTFAASYSFRAKSPEVAIKEALKRFRDLGFNPEIHRINESSIVTDTVEYETI